MLYFSTCAQFMYYSDVNIIILLSLTLFTHALKNAMDILTIRSATSLFI